MTKTRPLAIKHTTRSNPPQQKPVHLNKTPTILADMLWRFPHHQKNESDRLLWQNNHSA